jgi:hypothetical protein
MMPELGSVVASLLVVGLLVVMLAFALGTQRNISRGNARLRWLQSALPALGRRTTMRWLGSSAVQLDLVEPAEPFRDVTILYVLEPRDVPLLWLFSRASGRRDVLIVRANLRRAPRLELEAATRSAWIKAPDAEEAAGWVTTPFPTGVQATAVTGADASEVAAARRGWERLDAAAEAVWRMSIRRTVPHLEVHVRPNDAEGVPAARIVDPIRDLATELARH